MAVVQIPKIHLEKTVVEGVGVADLKKGPGHYPTTPMPGQPGNAAIAGHRTTYGGPFGDLDKLAAGDPILVTTRDGTFRYLTEGSAVVKPSQVSVLDPTPDNRLTLTTCHPKYSASQRLIVVARLQGRAVAPPPVAPQAPGRPAAARTPVDADLSGNPAAIRPAVIWGVLTALVALTAWTLAGRASAGFSAAVARRRQLVIYLAATPAFLVIIFFFFENLSRLLPANV
jgi:sortase A